MDVVCGQPSHPSSTKVAPLKELFIFWTHPGTVTLSLNPTSNSYSPYPRPQSDVSGKSEKAAAQSFQTLTRQEKHLLLFCVWIIFYLFFFLLLMVCCILSKNRHELCGGRSLFTENHFSSYQMTQLCFIM